VIALRKQYEVAQFIPKQFAAEAFSPPDGLFQPFIILSLEGLDHDPTTVTHELTHVISYNALTRQPPWFAEGLATYFETVRIADDGSFDLGARAATERAAPDWSDGHRRAVRLSGNSLQGWPVLRDGVGAVLVPCKR
jgi:hypothetical protein